MTKKEWLQQAEEYQTKSDNAEDESTKELYSVKAQACRENSAYGTED